MLASVRGLSLERKLPLLFSALLLVVIAVLAGSSLREVHQLAIVAARGRLESIASQFATASTDGYRRRNAALGVTARNDTVVRLVQAPSPAGRTAATKLLAPLSADTNSDIGVQVLDASGTPVFSSGRPPIEAMHYGGAIGDSSGLTALMRHDTAIIYAGSAPVLSSGHAIGRLVVWHRMQTTQKALKQVTDLFGPGAALYIGNPSGDVWVDLAGHTAQRAPVAAATGGFVEFDRTGGGPQLAWVRPILATPWLIEVDYDRSVILADQRTFLRRIGLLSLALLVIGAVTGVLASRRITRPLKDLTAAAESLARGEYRVSVRDYGRDEVGRLATSFRTMATQIQTQHEDLEHKVTSRTAELRAALKTIEETRDELVRKERLAILGQLSSGVGHELRNPLGVMNNAIYYLEAVLTDATPTTHEYLGILKTQIAISEKIVTDLLDFARLKKPDRHAVPIQSLIAESLKVLPPPANVRTQTELSPSVPTVLADPVHVTQILNNLTSNAYQAMGQAGGTLTIRATPDGPGNVQIEVSDTGPGIAPENIDKVFEPLFTTKARGIGLGLAVSRTLATSNGGALTAISPPGHGATFRLVLPAGEQGGAA